MVSDEILTPQEAADRYKVSKRTLQRLAAEGRVPALRVGAQLRFRVSDLEAAFASLPLPPPARRPDRGQRRPTRPK